MFEAFGLALELMDDSVIPSSLGAGNDVDPRIFELTRQLAITRAEIILFAAKSSNFEKARDKATQKRGSHLKHVRTEAKTLEKHNEAE